MNSYVLDFREIDTTQVARVGGKGANLGELSRLDGIDVPPGFCVTTDAYQRMIERAPSIDEHLDRLSLVNADDRNAIRALSAEIRAIIEAVTIDDDVSAAITGAVTRLGAHAAYAVRSSATAEDLPTASFAGQQDTYLNVVGPASILQHVSKCWASLFTDRAVSYRMRNAFDHRKVRMAVVVQQMVFPEASGVLFTADPVTGNRRVSSIDATFGLGEALVSGMVNADVYKVRDDVLVAKVLQQEPPTLADAQVVRLAQLGRRIEAHFGRPQDIEWCLVDDEFQIVQSRPITTLFPIPVVADNDHHVYVSVGHQQMMTDAFKPLGLSVWQLTTPRPMGEAGGRLFVDVTPMLSSPATRESLLGTLGKSDPLIRDALETVLDQGFVPLRPSEGPAWSPPGAGSAAIATDPALVAELIARIQTSIAELRRDIRPKSGSALLEFILANIQEMKRSDPRSIQVIMAGMEANWWLNDKMQEWLGEKNVSDTLTQSVPNNVTSEMGLALMDVADVVRQHPGLVAFLQHVTKETFLDELTQLDGGGAARDAIMAWLAKYGIRGVGEIDITRPRWSERPTMLLPMLLSHIENFGPEEAARRFDRGLHEARTKEAELLARLRALPDGERKAEETKRMIERMRTFAGYREYPKYGIVSRYFVYKQALMKEADRLVQAGVLRDREDMFYLRFEEIQDVERTNQVDDQLIRRRKDEFNSYRALTPPRVLTSEGEGITGTYRRDDLPAGALVGLPVCAGTVEGRARVILDIANADLAAGDILVTRYTDPAWTSIFVTISGLITEVGGTMTHGAVIAREYGLPAIVGVANATTLIRDGQRIRVNGTDGYVEILS